MVALLVGLDVVQDFHLPAFQILGLPVVLVVRYSAPLNFVNDTAVTLTGNTSKSGGAISLSSTAMKFSNTGDVNFTGNTAAGGGAIYTHTYIASESNKPKSTVTPTVVITFAANCVVIFENNTSTGASNGSAILGYTTAYRNASDGVPTTSTVKIIFAAGSNVTFRNHTKAPIYANAYLYHVNTAIYPEADASIVKIDVVTPPKFEGDYGGCKIYGFAARYYNYSGSNMLILSQYLENGTLKNEIAFRGSASGYAQDQGCLLP